MSVIRGICAPAGSADARPGPTRNDRLLQPGRLFTPIHFKSLCIRLQDPLQFRFIIDSGDSQLKDAEIQREFPLLQRYFKAALALPAEDFHIHLSPYAERLPRAYLSTELGVTVLYNDLLLKRMGASLLDPEREAGGAFWNDLACRVPTEMLESPTCLDFSLQLGLEPEEAAIFQMGPKHKSHHSYQDQWAKEARDPDTFTASVVADSLAPVCYTDSGSWSDAEPREQERQRKLAEIAVDVYREHFLPLLKRQLNEGEAFASMRQAWRAMILATWCKQEFKNNLILGRHIDSGRPWALYSKHLETDGGPLTTKSRAAIQAKTAAYEEIRVQQGDAHPAVADSAFELGKVLYKQGELESSLVTLERALAGRRQNLGPEDDATIETMIYTGRVYLTVGRIDDAVKLHSEAYEITRRSLGGPSSLTLDALRVFAMSCLAQGDLAKSKKLRAQYRALGGRDSTTEVDQSERQLAEAASIIEEYERLFASGLFERSVTLEKGTFADEMRVSIFSGSVDFRSCSRLLVESLA